MAKRVSAAELARTDAPAATPDASTPKEGKPAKAPKARASSRSVRETPRNPRIAPMPERMAAPKPLDCTEYGPDRKHHMSEMGPVAQSNWIGVVGGKRISVRMGAPQSTVPQDIQRRMAESGIGFEQAEPPPGRGAVLVTQRPEAPRARRREVNEVTRRSSPLRALPME